MNKTLVSLVSVPAVLLALAGSAMAAVPADVTTALSTIGADALTVAGVVLIAIISLFAFKFLRRGL
jgi:hypothetical protein